MIRKKDLVKEFELVVKQEIIEHNKAISASNLAVNKLSNRLDEIPKILSKEINDLGCANIRLSHDQEGVEVSLDKIKVLFTNLSNNQYAMNLRNHEEINTLDQSVEKTHKNQQISDKRIDKLEKTISSLKIVVKEILKDNECEKERTSNKIIKEVKALKKEILALPSEAEAVKTEFMEELSMHKIDNEGLLREIKVLKKTVFINEKKIEHLNTLIERMSTNIT